MTTWTPPFADGWYPRLSPDGRYLLCGNAVCRVVEIATKRIVSVLSGRYIAQGWLSPTQSMVANDGGLYRLDAPDFNAPVKIGPALAFAGCGGGIWAGGNTRAIWAGDADGHAVKIADGYGATVDETGTVVYAIDVHTQPKLVVWRSGQIQRTILPNGKATGRSLVGAGGYVGFGFYGPSWLNTPDNTTLEVGVTPDRTESPARAFRHLGAVWLVTTSDRGLYLRPLGVRDRAITLPTPAIDCAVVSLEDRFLVASQDAKGRLTLTEVPADAALLPVPVPIPAIGRPMWCGFINFIPAETPGNCRLNVSDMVVRDARGAAVALFVEGKPDGQLDAINRAIAEAKSVGLPIIAYWPRGLQAGPLPTGCDVTGVEAYRGLSETQADFEARVTAAVKRCPKAALICQAYTSNVALTSDLASLPPIYARIAKAQPNVWGLLAFSGSGRATGLNDHPEILPLWTALAAGIPSAPEAEFMEPWRVKFGDYDKSIERGQTSVARAAIGNGVDIEWQKDASDSIHFAVYKDGKLQDRSSSERHVEVRG